MRRILLTLFLVSMMIVASIGTAAAESILFPYIANTTAALDTIISVINTTVSPQLHYRYNTKAAGVANEAINPCNEYDFYRPSTMNDIVTFAVGRNAGLGGGNAMFNDPTNYNGGVGAPNFGHIHGSGRFGMLQVTTANANADVSMFSIASPFGWIFQQNVLDGEASLYDIATGAMWGYRAVPSNVDGAALFTAATINSYVYGNGASNGAGTGFGQTTMSTLSENIAFMPWMPRLGIYPPNQFTARLFVTPVLGTAAVPAAAVPADADMRFPNNKTTRVALLDFTGLNGMIDRNENPVSGGGPLDVRCVGRLNVVEIEGGALGALGPGQPLETVGGWAYLDLQNPGAIAPAPAVPAGFAANAYDASVMDLKFGNVTGMTGMVNDGKVMTDWGYR